MVGEFLKMSSSIWVSLLLKNVDNTVKVFVLIRNGEANLPYNCISDNMTLKPNWLFKKSSTSISFIAHQFLFDCENRKGYDYS